MGKTSKIFNRKPTLRSLAKRVDKIQGDTEVKWHHAFSYSVTALVITNGLRFNAPKTFLISGVGQGDGGYERIGDSITTTSLRLAGQVYMPGGGATLGVDFKARLIVWVYKKTAGVAPVLFGPSASAGDPPPLFLTATTGTYPAVWEQYNVAQECYEHYDVLYDKTYNLETKVGAWDSDSNTASSVNPAAYFEVNIPFRRKLGFRNYLPDVPSSCDTNAVYMTWITDSQSSYLQVEGMTRIGFKDL